VEITYGLERITMPLQREHHFRTMHWNKDYTYGEINYQGEVEHSKYYSKSPTWNASASCIRSTNWKPKKPSRTDWYCRPTITF